MIRVDVRAARCPLTWVKTRIALEPLRPGEALEVLVREGEPLENLPRTAVEEGHLVRERAPAPAEGEGIWRLVLVKGAPRQDLLSP